MHLAVVNTNPDKNSQAETLSNQEFNERLNSMYSGKFIYIILFLFFKLKVSIEYLPTGLVMTEKCLLKVFERNNLVQIQPAEGEKFDPNFHDAIFRVPIPGQTSGTVNVVTKIGFKLKERVIRAAQVGVVQ